MDYQIFGIYIGLIGVLVAVVVPTVTYFKQKEKKKLTFERLQSLSLININDDFKDKLEIKYADRVIRSLFLLTASIQNNGNLSIKKNDIITPIKISFPEKIIECVVLEENPKGIDVHLTINNDENLVECNFDLLNVGDYFTLKFVSLEELSLPTIIARIDGLSNISISSSFSDDSYLKPMGHGFNILFLVLKDMEFNKPIFTFTLPGIIFLIAGLYLGNYFLQTFAIGGSLSFGPTMLMALFIIVGTFLAMTGIILHSISFDRES